MLVNLTETLTLAAKQQDAWMLLRDTKRLAALIPGVESITSESASAVNASAAPAGERHVADVVEKVGPFRLNLKLGVTILRTVEPSIIEAELKGADAKSQNRVSGTLRAELKPIDAYETVLRVDASVEVLGKLAALGAPAIKKRTNELFAQFTERLHDEFRAAGQEPAA
jgi:carbon monoxide dehydrogenase subunit G